MHEIDLAKCINIALFRTRTGAVDNKHIAENWVNHMHPPHAKAAKGIAGLEF